MRKLNLIMGLEASNLYQNIVFPNHSGYTIMINKIISMQSAMAPVKKAMMSKSGILNVF